MNYSFFLSMMNNFLILKNKNRVSKKLCFLVLRARYNLSRTLKVCKDYAV